MGKTTNKKLFKLSYYWFCVKIKKKCKGCNKIIFIFKYERRLYCSRNCYNKNHVPWNKGKICPNISEAAKKRPMLVAGWNKGLPSEKQPRWNGGKYVYYHNQARKIMEKHIGRKIKKHEVVHHNNENWEDNRIDNLQVMTYSEHIKYHRN